MKGMEKKRGGQEKREKMHKEYIALEHIAIRFYHETVPFCWMPDYISTFCNTGCAVT